MEELVEPTKKKNSCCMQTSDQTSSQANSEKWKTSCIGRNNYARSSTSCVSLRCDSDVSRKSESIGEIFIQGVV